MPKTIPPREELDRVLAEHLPNYQPGEPFVVIARLEEAHGAYHKVVVRTGQIIRVLREVVGLSWRQIDQITKIEPGKAQRWMVLAVEQPEPAADWAQQSFGSSEVRDVPDAEE